MAAFLPSNIWTWNILNQMAHGCFSMNQLYPKDSTASSTGTLFHLFQWPSVSSAHTNTHACCSSLTSAPLSTQPGPLPFLNTLGTELITSANKTQRLFKNPPGRCVWRHNAL